MSSHAKASSAKSDRRHGGAPSRTSRAGRLARATALLAIAAFATLLLATSAQAVTYTTGTPLITGKVTTSVAVNQSSGDLYVASAGGENVPGAGVNLNADGALLRFSSAGAELSCAFSPAPSHPAGLAINPANGNIASVNLGFNPTDSELRTYPAGCGSELGVNSGTANTVEGSSELTAVSMAHPLQVGQGVSGPGIPTAALTGDIATSSATVTNVSLLSGKLAVGQAISATGVSSATVTLAGCVPDCTAPTEIELSAAAGTTATAANITARTIVKAFNEGAGTVELSNPAEETHSTPPASIEATAWHIEAATSAPIGQPAADSSGNVYWPNRTTNKLHKFAPWGQELIEGGFPVTMARPASVARDAQGNIYVTTVGLGLTTGALTCANTANGKLVKLKPNGEAFPAGGPIGTGSVFAGLTGGVSTVAVDSKTGNVYVGRGCAATFKVEVYGPGGTKLAENIGEGLFLASPVIGGTALLNQLAVDETSGKLYAVDPGNELAWTFDNTSASKTLATSVPGGNGAIVCNGTGNACLAEYDEGQEVIAEAEPDPGFQLKEWTGGTGSASSCSGTSGPCTFILNADSSIEAVFESAGPPSFPLNLSNTGSGTGTFACKVLPGGSEGPCAAEYEEGEEVEVLNTPASGSHFVSWGGDCTGSGSCVVVMSAERTVSAQNDLDEETFAVNQTGNGTVSCEDNASPASCSSPFLNGHTIKVTATPEAGWELTSLTGSGSAAGSCSSTTASGSCEFQIAEASEVSATFTQSEETFAVNQTGNGTVSCEDNASPASCSGPFLSGHTIKVTATPEAGWELTSLTGSGSAAGSCSSTTASGSCEFTIAEASEVSVTFTGELANPSTLYVFKGGNGGGTVTSNPAGINCGTEPCEATYEEGETIELTATPGSGSVVAGWIGCRPVAGEINKCNVTLKGEEVEVTAIFLVEGIQGEDGATGPTGATGDDGATGPTGPSGATGPTGNSGAPGDDGEAGATGPQGTQGPAGQDGSNGADGTDGTDGKNGANGAPGPQGPQGPQGPEGPQGPTGKVKVTCKVDQNGAQVKVTCKVQQAQSRKKQKRRNLRWRLMQGGHAQSHGTSKGSLRLNLSHLKPGRYVLNVNGQATRIVVPAHHNG